MTERHYKLTISSWPPCANGVSPEWAEFKTDLSLSAEDNIEAFQRFVVGAAMCAWHSYRDAERMAQAVDEASKP